MIRIVRADAGHQDFIELVKYLDADLAERDGGEHAINNQFNTVAKIKYAVVAYENQKPVGCGAISEYASHTAELKRMYTLPDHRGKGIAAKVLAELEAWAGELSYGKCLLETGWNQPEAIAFYGKNGYQIIPSYGRYAEIENSVCFEKEIKR